ncbi:hypothetical protein [Streptomyces acidiscabies]|uniref:Uncharacterized protein n=1 Tax=Streptomyces acidiscabies TaxID=42234 RepID=A0AAP6ELB2_9ACTN|nr:hypothetical protein [Streptomyces acidiscabies]MBZ3918161.1 hypothetical protein [Streptomyces acidiscabies]MDX2966441.1 hypothetical protein [Streptomyces acidiscabies]MDX3796387.1 hypothetical protein [Streptomyces acidiscabies]
MAKMDPEAREQLLEGAETLLLTKYSGGRDWIEPVRVMHAVRAAADRYGLDDAEQAEVPADDVLAALTQLDEARAALDTLERDLTRAARRRGASWQQVADSLGLATRSSAESRFVRLERDAATYRGDRYPERQRAERARDRAGEAWCRANAPRLRAAVWSLACLDDSWPQLARTAPAEKLDTWHRELDGPGLAARLRALRLILDSYGAELPAGTEAAAARDEVLGLLEELHAARHGLTD